MYKIWGRKEIHKLSLQMLVTATYTYLLHGKLEKRLVVYYFQRKTITEQTNLNRIRMSCRY